MDVEDENCLRINSLNNQCFRTNEHISLKSRLSYLEFINCTLFYAMSELRLDTYCSFSILSLHSLLSNLIHLNN